MLRKPLKRQEKRCSKRTTQQWHITGKHLGPPADKQAFVLLQVYISKPVQNSPQGRVLVPAPSHHPWRGYSGKSLHYNLNYPLPPSLWLYQEHKPLCSELPRKIVANLAFSGGGLILQHHTFSEQLMHKCRHFSHIKNILFNHKTVLPSGFAQICKY